MNEKQIKEICKWIVDHGNRPLTDLEKKAIKQAIDHSKNVQELAEVAFSAMCVPTDRR